MASGKPIILATDAIVSVFHRRRGETQNARFSMLLIKPLTDSDFHHTLAQSEGVSIVMFSGPDCGTCRKVEKLLPQTAAGLVSNLYKVDVQHSMGLARQYEVFHLPTLFLFVNGHYHAPLHSEVTPGKLQTAIEAALAQPAEEEP